MLKLGNPQQFESVIFLKVLNYFYKLALVNQNTLFRSGQNLLRSVLQHQPAPRRATYRDAQTEHLLVTGKGGIFKSKLQHHCSYKRKSALKILILNLFPVKKSPALSQSQLQSINILIFTALD